MTLWLVLFWGSILAVVEAVILFPLLLLVRGALFPRPWRRAPVQPRVSLIVACHDEAAGIARRIENALALDYPPGKLEVLIVSDGSTDGTAEIARGYTGRGVVTLELPRSGKAQALNAGAAAATGEVLAFSDANSRFDRDALAMLVRNLADPAVGGVAGDQRYDSGGGGGAAGERGYWSYDRLLKAAESRAGNVISATGSIHCLRRELFRPVPEGVTDDFVLSTGVIAQGRRLVFEPQAVAREPVAASGGAEFRRKTRILSRGLRAVWVMRELANPFRHGFYAVQLLHHKVLRRLLALPLLALLAASLALWTAGPFYRAAALAQLAFYAAAAAGQLLAGTAAGRLKALAVPRWIALVQLACLVALANLLLGRRIDRWSPERARPPAGAVPPPRRPLPPCSVIVPTYNRPAALERCLRSLCAQTVPPAELIVVDDGRLPGLPLAKDFERRGVPWVLHRKAVPGLTESRAAGVSLVRRGEVVAFLDDDTVLEPDYLERLLEPYAEDTAGRVGGVEGVATNRTPVTPGRWLRWAAGVLLLHTGFREGRVLPSGFCVDVGTTPFAPRDTVPVEFLSGGICSYRRAVLARFRFTPGYHDMGGGEDKDFSFPVGREWRLLLAPAARLLHEEAPQMRPDDRGKGRRFVLGRWLFFRDHVRPARGAWTTACCWYAILGYVGLRALIWLVTRRRRHLARVHGALEGVREILRGKVGAPVASGAPAAPGQG